MMAFRSLNWSPTSSTVILLVKSIQFSVPIAAKGTPFQQSVWQALTTIPYGETWSYAQLGRRDW